MGTRNDIYNDYESFIAKFNKDLPKTTDECVTPKDVYEAVVDYVRTIYDMEGKVIVRPFYPGGDYEQSEYPENCIVIDNPPFSKMCAIVAFYNSRNIPYFLFTNGLTSFGYTDRATVVVAGAQIRFANGAYVNSAFITNVMGDVCAISAPQLHDAIKACPSQKEKNTKKITMNEYPSNVVRYSELATIAQSEEFAIRRDEMRKVAKFCDTDVFGCAMIVPDYLWHAKERAKESAKESAKERAKKERARDARHLQLSDEQLKMVDELNRAYLEKNP